MSGNKPVSYKEACKAYSSILSTAAFKRDGHKLTIERGEAYLLSVGWTLSEIADESALRLRKYIDNLKNKNIANKSS